MAGTSEGRPVAWRNNTTLRYFLGDHLSSTHGELDNQTDVAQRRYYPFGSDRSVSGANDLTRDERFTGQRRIEAGGGNARRELYHYGARAYLPGVGIFAQPDSVVPDYKNPQALNRFSYCLNNPVRYVDASGQDPIGPDWVQAFKAAHGGRDPGYEDYLDRLLSYATKRAWTDADWQVYTRLKQEGKLDPHVILDLPIFGGARSFDLAKAAVALHTCGSAGSGVLQYLLSHGARVQFGGGPGQLPGTSMAWDNAVYLDLQLQGEAAEIIAANIAHEAYHIQMQEDVKARLGPIDWFKWPWSKQEEVGAFSQQARAWAELKVTYEGTGWRGQRQEDLLQAWQGGQDALLKYVNSIDLYRDSWFYNVPGIP